MDFSEVWIWIQAQIKTNQFLSGAVGGSLFYAALTYFKSIYNYALGKISTYFTRQITLTSYENGHLYQRFNSYFAEKIKEPLNISIREKIVDNDNEQIIIDNSYDYSDRTNKKLSLFPILSYGTHWYIYNFYTLIYINISNEKDSGQTKSEIMEVSIISLRPRKIRLEIQKMFNDAFDELQNSPKTYSISNDSYCNISLESRSDRKIESIFINQDIKNSVMNSILKLKNKEKIYSRIGATQTLGILLYGPPGTGKSTFIAAIAHELKRNLYYLHLDEKNSRKLSKTKEMLPNSILVIEDIDCSPAVRNRKEEDSERTDLASILKMLDGASLPNNTIIFATTNNIEDLDPAIIRAGRFDLRVELEKADKELTKQMIEYIDPSKLHMLDEFVYPISQAEVQAKVLKI